MKKILFIEPFHGGSHQVFVRGLISHSSHRIDRVTLPACNWQWRLNGSAAYFARQGIRFEDYDGIIVSGMLRLCDLKALAGRNFPPVLVYFHETQLTYPRGENEKKDKDPGIPMADISTALCADRIAFNSGFHRDAFLKAVSEYMVKVPDFPLIGIVDEIRDKSMVLYPGMDFHDGTTDLWACKPDIPLVIWNHRWSYDKNAASFFYAVNQLVDQGIEFELAVLGECQAQRIPDVFQKAKDRLGQRVVHFGFVENRDEYMLWLKRGTVVVSTALQENFGMAMVEAIRLGCLPLLPNRLSYPEILPHRFHDAFLYSNQKEFLFKFRELLLFRHLYKKTAEDLANALNSHSWRERIVEYDNELERLCRCER